MYFITTVSEKNGFRCVGYYKSSSEAIKTVENNTFDLNEAGYYPYAVIENIPEGLYHYDENPIWFEWNKITERYKRINFPPKFIEKGFVGFSIG